MGQPVIWIMEGVFDEARGKIVATDNGYILLVHSCAGAGRGLR
jgi:hypothetical protein